MWSIDKFFTKQIDSYREEDDVLEDVVFCNPLNSYHLEILPSRNRNISSRYQVPIDWPIYYAK